VGNWFWKMGRGVVHGKENAVKENFFRGALNLV